MTLTLKFDWEYRGSDKREYIILSLDRKDFCPLAIGLDLCKSTDHKHYCSKRIGFEEAKEHVASERKLGREVKVMDRVY